MHKSDKETNSAELRAAALGVWTGRVPRRRASSNTFYSMASSLNKDIDTFPRPLDGMPIGAADPRHIYKAEDCILAATAPTATSGIAARG
ncbi:jg3564 [Pararge aegeria aegeria]|uniref:Jg3564 protein n=1 Tax=Pararge aegeria aegeria TaxID=348720 RepID=A0A8S4QJ69_9NEOP|nr:jg3564 [Pararge aegeria aegeria]